MQTTRPWWRSSLGPGNRFDAHVDKVSPTDPAKAGRTEMDLARGWLHHRHEVHVDLAGVAGGPTLDQPRVVMPEDRNNPTAPLMVDITLSGPVKGK